MSDVKGGVFSALNKCGPLIQAAGSVVAALIITFGAFRAARTFEPRFVRVGEHVINIEHLVEVAQDDDGDGCQIIISISESFVAGTPEQFTQNFAGHDVDETTCQMLRGVLDEYTVDGRPSGVQGGE